MRYDSRRGWGNKVTVEHLKRARLCVPEAAKQLWSGQGGGGASLYMQPKYRLHAAGGPGERAPCAAHMYRRQGLHVPARGWALVPVAQDPLAWLQQLGLGEGREQKETKEK